MKTKIINVFKLLLGECAIVALLYFFIRVERGLEFDNYMNTLGFTLIIGMLLVVVTAAGSLKELGYAFKYCIIPDSDISASQIRKSVHAVKLAMITSMFTGGIITLFNLITVLCTDVNLVTIEEKLYEVGPGQLLIAYSLNGLTCGIFMALLFLPIWGRLKRMVLSDMDDVKD